MRKFIYLVLALVVLLGFSVQVEKKAYSQEQSSIKKAYVAGGCFWCVEADFEKKLGVIGVVSGYAGGKVVNPTYKQVSKGNTGHIEAVEITYDANIVTYEELLTYLYTHIDPLDGGGQFCDRGYQYKSAIFPVNEKETKIAQKVTKWAYKQLKKEIKTKLLPYINFYSAEGYHQDYYKKNPLRYNYYKYSCGRDKRVLSVWKDYKASEESQILPQKALNE